MPSMILNKWTSEHLFLLFCENLKLNLVFEMQTIRQQAQQLSVICDFHYKHP